ncbi:MAG: hypothetical protein H0W98_07430, partial [Chloroflexi bacterium]|nr:hypothetical protein [Chloroflexota bacterium]
MRIAAGRAMLACLAVACALALAGSVPLLAPVIVWPLLFFVPGWALLAVLRPRIDGAGRLGLAIIVSV